jgi:hypothetical protein
MIQVLKKQELLGALKLTVFDWPRWMWLTSDRKLFVYVGFNSVSVQLRHQQGFSAQLYLIHKMLNTMAQVHQLYYRGIGKVVFTLLQRTSDKNECCCQLLCLWNKKILPNPPVEELATQKMLETTQVILHGIGIAASEVLLDGDLTMVPDVITLWPSLWNWIKLLHAELCTGSHLAFDIAAAQQCYGAFVRALMFFTGFSSELLHTITEMPGYISMVTLLWIEEVRDPHRHFGFTVSNLIAPLVSHWTDQIIAICGGKPINVVMLCLKHITANLQSAEPDYMSLRPDLVIFLSSSEDPGASLHRAFASSSKSIPVIMEAMSRLVSWSQPTAVSSVNCFHNIYHRGSWFTQLPMYSFSVVRLARGAVVSFD